MKILLVGATGLLGNKLLSTVPTKYHLIPTFYKNFSKNNLHLNITNSKMVKKLISQLKPQLIIHAASIGDVDYCQKHQSEAWRVNVLGTKNLLKAASLIKAKFIFFSSNAVFDGENPPYYENSPTHPVNYYGLTKVAAENLVKTYLPNSIIFRLTTMYGWNNAKERKNPATWLIDRLTKKIPTPVVRDVFINFLWVGQAATAVWQTIRLKKFGETFHIADKDCISRFEFAKKLSQVFGFNNSLIKSTTSFEFRNLAPRPKNACLITKKMQIAVGIKPISVLSGLKLMYKESLWSPTGKTRGSLRRRIEFCKNFL